MNKGYVVRILNMNKYINPIALTHRSFRISSQDYVLWSIHKYPQRFPLYKAIVII